MTKILFERTGGFMSRKVSATIDLDELTEEQAESLGEMLDDADFFELPSNLAQSSTPDSFTYDITVTSAKGQHSIRVSDTNAPDDLRPLLNELNKVARMQR